MGFSLGKDRQKRGFTPSLKSLPPSPFKERDTKRELKRDEASKQAYREL